MFIDCSSSTSGHQDTVTTVVDPRYDGVPGNWQWKYDRRYNEVSFGIEVLFHIFYYYWGEENGSLYRGSTVADSTISRVVFLLFFSAMFVVWLSLLRKTCKNFPPFSLTLLKQLMSHNLSEGFSVAVHFSVDILHYWRHFTGYHKTSSAGCLWRISREIWANRKRRNIYALKLNFKFRFSMKSWNHISGKKVLILIKNKTLPRMLQLLQTHNRKIHIALIEQKRNQ